MPVTRRIARPVVRKIVRAVNQAVAGMFDEASFFLDLLGSTETLDPRITFSRASGGTRTNSSGVLELVGANVPRFDYDPVTLQPRGFLIEEQRTNSIRNNTMVGAVAGTPGTLPTNWASSSIGGISLTEIVSTGVENGIAYVDVRYAGTTSSSASGGITTDGTTQIAALSGQSWASSFYVRLVGGSLNGIASISNAIQERSSSATLLVATNDAITLTSVMRRVSVMRTLNNASTAFVNQQIRITPESGVAIDITLRIGLPQLELGAKESSVIPTSGAAATRAADIAPCTGTNFSSWYRADEGTIFVDGTAASVSAFMMFATLSDGTAGNEIRLSTQSAGNNPGLIVNAGGVTQATSYATAAQGVAVKVAGSYAANNFNAAANGTLATPDTSGSIPVVDRLTIGARGNNTLSINGHIRRIAFFPRAFSAAELQALTS